MGQNGWLQISEITLTVAGIVDDRILSLKI